MDMKTKFERLMSTYLTMVSKPSDADPPHGIVSGGEPSQDGSRGSNSSLSRGMFESQRSYSEDSDSVLSVEETLSELKSEFETELSKHERRRTLTPMKLRTLDTSAVASEFASLRAAVRASKSELDALRSIVASNVSSIKESTSKAVMIFAKRTSERHTREIEECRCSLMEALQRQEDDLNSKLSDQTLEHFEEIKQIRRTMLDKIEDSFSKSPAAAKGSYNQSISSSRLETPDRGPGGSSMATGQLYKEDDVGSSAEAVRTVVRLELVVRAILNALVGLGLISADTGATLEGIALSSGDHWEDLAPHTGIGSDASSGNSSGQITALYNLLVSSLSAYVGKSEGLVVKMDALTRDLHREMTRRQEVESHLLELQDTSDMHSVRLQEASVEIVQARNEHEMLSELQLIETSSRVKGLLSRIQEIKSEHLVELEELRADNTEQQAALRVNFEKELTQKQHYHELLVTTLETKLKSEQTKRQSLQAELIEARVKHQGEIKSAELEKLEVQRRCHDLEVEFAKLKLQHHRDDI